jgi:hypothetical protein
MYRRLNWDELAIRRTDGFLGIAAIEATLTAARLRG